MAMHNRSAAALATVFLSLSPSALSAGVLITHRGEKVETTGAWEVEGKLVVFSLPGGRFASLQVSEVDVPASHRATAATLAAVRDLPGAPPPSELKEARVAITDESLRRVARPVSRSEPRPILRSEPRAVHAASIEPALREKEEILTAVPATRIVVASWERGKEDGRTIVSGSLRNDAPADARRVSITALLYDAAGRLLASERAALSSTVLPAGQSTGFQAVLPAVSGGASSVRFEVRGVHPFPGDKIVTVGNKSRS